MHIVPGLGDGGAEAILYRLIKSLKQFEYRVVCLGKEGKYSVLLRELGIRVDVLDLEPNFAGFLRLPIIVRIYMDFRPQVIQGWLYHGNLVASIFRLAKKKPRVLWALHHSDLVRGVDPWHTHASSKLCAMLSPSTPDAIICVANSTKRAHFESGYNSEKMVVISNGYDVEHFRPDSHARNSLRSALGIGKNLFVFGTVARYAPQKDIPNALNAISKLASAMHQFVFLFVGEGMSRENHELTMQIKRLGIEDYVQLLGTQQEIHKIYPALDVFVSSSAFGEAFPNVISEAMSCGVPCVTTDVGDSALIVGQTGKTVPPSDARELSIAMQTMMVLSQKKTEWANRKSDARARIVEEFNLVSSASGYEKLWMMER